MKEGMLFTIAAPTFAKMPGGRPVYLRSGSIGLALEGAADGSLKVYIGGRLLYVSDTKVDGLRGKLS